MPKLIKFLVPCCMLFNFSGCASLGSTYPPSVNIKYSPAIDVSYQQAVKSLEQHIGVNVRWGGQIIKAEDIGSKTLLTVISFPLLEGGKPDSRSTLNNEAARFIVEIENFDESSNHQLITVYGPIIGAYTVTNGNIRKEIPIVGAIETQDWSLHSSYRPYSLRFKYGLPYHGLAYDNYGGSHFHLGTRFSYYPGYYSYTAPRFYHRRHRH